MIDRPLGYRRTTVIPIGTIIGLFFLFGAAMFFPLIDENFSVVQWIVIVLVGGIGLVRLPVPAVWVMSVLAAIVAIIAGETTLGSPFEREVWIAALVLPIAIGAVYWFAQRSPRIWPLLLVLFALAWTALSDEIARSVVYGASYQATLQNYRLALGFLSAGMAWLFLLNRHQTQSIIITPISHPEQDQLNRQVSQSLERVRALRTIIHFIFALVTLPLLLIGTSSYFIPLIVFLIATLGWWSAEITRQRRALWWGAATLLLSGLIMLFAPFWNEIGDAVGILVFIIFALFGSAILLGILALIYQRALKPINAPSV